jgi:hypothetical protein
LATRPELKIICEELNILSEGLDKSQMVLKIKEVVNRRFKKRWAKWQSADAMSTALKKFLTQEHDYVIRDKGGNELDYLGRIIKKKKRKGLTIRKE